MWILFLIVDFFKIGYIIWFEISSKINMRCLFKHISIFNLKNIYIFIYLYIDLMISNVCLYTIMVNSLSMCINNRTRDWILKLLYII